MKHLSDGEIIEFVTADTADGTTCRDIARVNLHILSCGECLQRVKAYSIIYGEGMTGQPIRRKKLVNEPKEKELTARVGIKHK